MSESPDPTTPTPEPPEPTPTPTPGPGSDLGLGHILPKLILSTCVGVTVIGGIVLALLRR